MYVGKDFFSKCLKESNLNFKRKKRINYFRISNSKSKNNSDKRTLKSLGRKV